MVGTAAIWIAISIVWGVIQWGAATLSIIAAVADGEMATSFSEVVSAPILKGVASALSVPEEMWEWARNKHPIWAATIGIACLSGVGLRR